MITSSQNNRIKTVRALLTQRQERLQYQQYVIEGVRLVEEAVANGIIPALVLYSIQLSDRGFRILDKLEESNCEIQEITPSLMHSLSDTDTPQGILAVIPMQSAVLPKDANFIVLADQLRDPGNMGTLLRTSLAAGVQAVILTSGTTDVYAPKIVRSAMGAHFRLPLVECSWEEIEAWRQASNPAPTFWISDVREGTACWEADLRTPLMLGIGGEAEGMSSTAFSIPHQKIHIPMRGQSESLNASIAAGILIFEVIRQRSIPT
ncbi:MAG: RNA methyltransferase [Anaerolineaceae bacterium]